MGVYGGEGYSVSVGTTNLPSFASVTKSAAPLDFPIITPTWASFAAQVTAEGATTRRPATSAAVSAYQAASHQA